VEKSDPIDRFSMVFIEFLDDATRSSQTEKNPPSKCIEGLATNFIAPEHA